MGFFSKKKEAPSWQTELLTRAKETTSLSHSFEIGCLVVHKADCFKRRMVVMAYDDYRYGTYKECEWVTVEWMDDTGSHKEMFSPYVLTKVSV